MDVMACQVSRSGNYQSQLDYVQVIFPEREISVYLASKSTPIYTQSGAPKNPHDRVDSLPGGLWFSGIPTIMRIREVVCGE